MRTTAIVALFNNNDNNSLSKTMESDNYYDFTLHAQLSPLQTELPTPHREGSWFIHCCGQRLESVLVAGARTPSGVEVPFRPTAH